ncbi:hypothetical protein CKAN_01883700 [Cinnamomum micranthum f. kanehirae]|uniref:Transmembrane protein n=1 Tax=Cinnamomum micranthum f. kanehirae TaxID=337451 RepID=A0A443PG66_9MAGN|nr:hypothetical protein CKAN_01883700 [Cinnamomum micranthum f. kanehirae]
MIRLSWLGHQANHERESNYLNPSRSIGVLFTNNFSFQGLKSCPFGLLKLQALFSNRLGKKKGDAMVDLGNGFWWWAGASSAQLAAGVAACRRGFRGRDTLMPVKAFGVASLFVGAGATAFAGFLYASGIHKVRKTHTFAFHRFTARRRNLECCDLHHGRLGFIWIRLDLEVDDMKEVGKSIRKKMRVPPREKNTSA